MDWLVREFSVGREIKVDFVLTVSQGVLGVSQCAPLNPSLQVQLYPSPSFAHSSVPKS